MEETYTKLCRICLTNNSVDNITDSSCFAKFFIQVIGLKKFKETPWLCMWCKTAVRNAKALFKLALESENNFHKKVSTDISTKPKRLHSINCIHNSHIDIPPFIIEFQDFKTENILEETDETTNPLFEIQDYEIQINENRMKSIDNMNEESFSNKELIINKETISNIESISNKESFSNMEYETNENEKETKRKNKKEFDFSELKFEVEYLNLEEQLKEVELKKLKYQDFEFQCDECGLGFLTSDVFEEHKVRHSELSGPHKCPICSLRFKSRDVFSQHGLAHKRRFRCALCRCKYKRWSHCVAHRYKCGAALTPRVSTHCGKVFSNEYSLKIHMKVHKTEKKHSCDQCDKKFSGKHRLTVHMRSHTGVKPFLCTQCPRAFTTRSNLRAHSAVHSHTTEFYCVECDTYYKTAKSLKRHFNESAKHGASKNDMYSCEECTKQFCSEKALNYHISTRHGTEHRCTQCDKTFSNNSNLNKHIKCIHTAK